jgi:hypothetical protein
LSIAITSLLTMAADTRMMAADTRMATNTRMATKMGLEARVLEPKTCTMNKPMVRSQGKRGITLAAEV